MDTKGRETLGPLEQDVKSSSLFFFFKDFSYSTSSNLFFTFSEGRKQLFYMIQNIHCSDILSRIIQDVERRVQIFFSTSESAHHSQRVTWASPQQGPGKMVSRQTVREK